MNYFSFSSNGLEIRLDKFKGKEIEAYLFL